MSWIDRDDDGELVFHMDLHEHALLVTMLEQLDEAIDGPTDSTIVQRLFPPAVEGDADEDAELRAIIASDLLLRRHEAIGQVLTVLRDVELPDDLTGDDLDDETAGRSVVDVRLVDDAPGMVLSVLNDVRLALASSVGLTAVELPQLVDEDDERTLALLQIMDYFGSVQMRLLHHIDPISVDLGEPDRDG